MHRVPQQRSLLTVIGEYIMSMSDIKIRMDHFQEQMLELIKNLEVETDTRIRGEIRDEIEEKQEILDDIDLDLAEVLSMIEQIRGRI